MGFKPVDIKPQKELLLQHFATDPTISGVKASAMYRIRDLPKRMSELAQDGHVIIKTRKKDPRGQRYTEYRYGGKRKPRPAEQAFEGVPPVFFCAPVVAA